MKTQRYKVQILNPGDRAMDHTIDADDIEIDGNSIVFTKGEDVVFICPCRWSVVQHLGELVEPGPTEGDNPIQRGTESPADKTN